MATLGALTYSQLVTAVSDYTQNTFDTTDMNTMIQQAEQRIYNSVSLPNLRKTSTTALTASVNTFNAPTDFLAVYSFAVVDASGNFIYLLNKDPAFMQEAQLLLRLLHGLVLTLALCCCMGHWLKLTPT